MNKQEEWKLSDLVEFIIRTWDSREESNYSLISVVCSAVRPAPESPITSYHFSLSRTEWCSQSSRLKLILKIDNEWSNQNPCEKVKRCVLENIEIESKENLREALPALNIIWMDWGL